MRIKNIMIAFVITILAFLSGMIATNNVNAQSTTPKWVCSIQAVYLYQQPTFKTNQRLNLIKSQDRQKYPVFQVIKTARSQQNQLRYQVRVLSGEYKNKVGYVTANKNFVQPLYYTSNQIRKVQVIAPKIKLYYNVIFKQPIKVVKQGHNVKVIGITKNEHGRYRLMLTNHRYITANQKFVLDLADAKING